MVSNFVLFVVKKKLACPLIKRIEIFYVDIFQAFFGRFTFSHTPTFCQQLRTIHLNVIQFYMPVVFCFKTNSGADTGYSYMKNIK